MKLLLLPTLACALVGCSIPSPIVERPNTTTQQMNRDMGECRNNPPTFGFGNYVTKCMEARGYTIISRD
jgi:hypothetical protein